MTDDFRDMLGLLKKYDVDFLLVGAHAMAAHSTPRATGDIDLWVRATPENAKRLWHVLTEFGAPLANASPEDFAQPGDGLHIGIPPWRIDILTKISGVSFDEAWPQRIEADVLGHTVPVIGKHHLIQNKRAAARGKDLIDAERLESDRDDVSD
jgi:hypothetical protein